MGPGLGVGSIWVIAYEEFDIPYMRERSMMTREMRCMAFSRSMGRTPILLKNSF